MIAVTRRRWPCLLHPYITVGRGRWGTLDIVRKKKGWRPQFHGLSGLRAHWPGWVRWDQTWTGAATECALTCWRPISPLWFLRIIQPLAASEESWHSLFKTYTTHIWRLTHALTASYATVFPALLLQGCHHHLPEQERRFQTVRYWLVIEIKYWEELLLPNLILLKITKKKKKTNYYYTCF